MRLVQSGDIIVANAKWIKFRFRIEKLMQLMDKAIADAMKDTEMIHIISLESNRKRMYIATTAIVSEHMHRQQKKV